MSANDLDSALNRPSVLRKCDDLVEKPFQFSNSGVVRWSDLCSGRFRTWTGPRREEILRRPFARIPRSDEIARKELDRAKNGAGEKSPRSRRVAPVNDEITGAPEFRRRKDE